MFLPHRTLSIRLVLAIIFLLGICFSSTALADPPNWERWDEGLPAIAPVLTLAADPEQPQSLYAGIYSLPGLWHSADGGETWTQAGQSEGSRAGDHPVIAMLWDAKHQGWWAGTNGGLLFRPVASSEWRLIPALAGPISSLALDEDGRLYAVQTNEGLFRQEIDGIWTHLRQESQALVVAVSPPDQHIFLGTAGRGLWISRDGGENWRQIPNLCEEYIISLLVEPGPGQRLYASTSQEVYQSEDGGRIWQPVSELKERAYAFVLAPDGTLYVGLEGRIARCQNQDQSWSFSGQGLPPQMPVFDLSVVRQAKDDYLLYAATRDGVYRSMDQGKSWQRRSRGLGNIEVLSLDWDGKGGMIAATPLGLYHRSSGEEKWEPTASTFKYKRFYDVSSHPTSGTIYAGMQSGLVRSTDWGQSWQEVVSDLTSHGMPAVLVDPKDSKHLFIRLAFERIYESNDGGQTWQARWTGMETHHEVLAMARSSSGEFWAGTQEGLFIWDAPAQQWQEEPLPVPGPSIFAITFDPDGKTGYVGASTGLWRRRQGSDWQPCAPHLIKDTVSALAALPNGHIYAGISYAGLYRSCDGGVNWQPVSGFPATSTVNALLVDEAKGLVYAATDQGLFRGNDTTCPASQTAPWPAVWPGIKSLISKIAAILKPLLAPSRQYPPVQPLPAVHTLRADDPLLRQASEIGFRAVVQVFSWQELEPTRGEWHWEYPDFLLQAAEFYDLDLIVRLDHPPAWALPATSEQTNDEGFPFEVEAYLKFVEAVAQRYQGRIRGYIIWNEPNLASEWGGPPDPLAYTRLLQRAYEVIKQQDPAALVISAGLSSTNTSPDAGEQSNQAMDDRLFLEKMYQAGARPFFDALGAHPYGFAYPPDDPPGAHDGLNMNRLLELRAMMETYGDAAKPVWATEIGWTTRGVGEHHWLTVSPERQAAYLARAWEKANIEFPWLHVFTVWNLSQGLPEPDEKAGYSLLDEDGTPKPAYGRLQETFASAAPGHYGSVLLKILNWLSPDFTSPIVILARDAETHLGDSE
jgi:photosystem II stability/assembly factor-like uncharacterized protein